MTSPAAASRRAGTSIADRVDGLDWAAITAGLDDVGVGLSAPILDAGECRSVIDLYDDGARFRSTVDMARHRFGEGQQPAPGQEGPEGLISGCRALPRGAG